MNDLERNDLEFDHLLSSVLREMAEVEPRAGFTMRMKAGVAVEALGAVQAANQEETAMTGTIWTGAAEEVGVMGSLWAGLRDLIVRPKLAPLMLESQPIAVVDRMAVRRGFGPVGWAVAAHVLAIFLVAFALVEAKARFEAIPANTIALTEPLPIKLPPRATSSGGGGGQASPTPAAQGHLPKFASTTIVPPMAPPTVQAKLMVEPTVNVPKDLKMADNTLPNLGMPNSPILGTGSLGNGYGGGIGPGHGDGVGPGSGKGMGGGAFRVGGGVSAPEILVQPDPEFSEEARKSKISGNVIVFLWVDAQGKPSHVRVVRGIGFGLDEKAMAAVSQYRFKPAMKDGKPVTVEMNVEVDFRIF